jgi:hypothetical protein
MGIMGNNNLVGRVSGKVGNVVFRQIRGKTVVANLPTRKGQFKPSQKQSEVMNRFTKASQYAREAMIDPARQLQYKGGVNGKLTTPRLVAISDYLNAPTIVDIDVSQYHGEAGNIIHIDAHDDFLVTKVSVQILSNGELVEQGDANTDLADDLFWNYSTTRMAPLGELTIRVTAFDLAGNETTKKVVI